MKGLKTTLVSAVAIGLLAGSKATLVVATTLALTGALAQAAVALDDEPTTPAYVTCGLVLDEQTFREDAGTFTEGRVRYVWSQEADVISSDPRLVGRATVKAISDGLTAGRDRTLDVWRMVIENDEGAWHGVVTGYAAGEQGFAQSRAWRGVVTGYAGDEQGFAQSALLEGSGAYEGLSTVLSVGLTSDGMGVECGGLLFKGTLPPVPAAE